MSGRQNWSRIGGRRERFYRWLLLTGDRKPIVAALTATTFAVTSVVTGGYLPQVRVSAVSVIRLSTALAGGLLPFITLVLTINQLAISMELGSVFHLDRRFEAMREFREGVTALTDCVVCPAEPAPLLEALFDAIAQRASSLSDSEVEAVAGYGDRLASELTSIRPSSDADLFDTLVETRRYNFGAHIHDIERVQTDLVADEYADALDDLERLHEHLDIAQKFFWTIYIEDEMAMLARNVLYFGLLGLLAGVALSLGLNHFLELGADGRALTLVVSVAITLEILPFAILFAYMLRIATVARTTSGFGPFVTDGPGWDCVDAGSVEGCRATPDPNFAAATLEGCVPSVCPDRLTGV